MYLSLSPMSFSRSTVTCPAFVVSCVRIFECRYVSHLVLLTTSPLRRFHTSLPVKPYSVILRLSASLPMSLWKNVVGFVSSEGLCCSVAIGISSGPISPFPFDLIVSIWLAIRLSSVPCVRLWNPCLSFSQDVLFSSIVTWSTSMGSSRS